MDQTQASSLPRSLGRILSVCALAFLAAVTVQAAPVKFDIPAQSASTALPLFIRQSNATVVFNREDVQGVQANAVVGSYEVEDALGKLLAKSGLTFRRNGEKFLVVPGKEKTLGSIRGSLTGEGGRPLSGAMVVVRDTMQSATTDRSGEFAIPDVAPGNYLLVATSAGYQTMHIADVQVRAAHEVVISSEAMRKPLGEVTALEPYVVHADTVQELERYEVTATKQKPFADANVDIPRTINDVQPYYIIDSKTIDDSGVNTVQDLLKQRVTMNTVKAFTTQRGAGYNGSAINLRGIGTDKTLVLVNGRRVAGVSASGGLSSSGQVDLNGIPLAAIDRIEILPSSSSGIYGGSALGGVINVILKRDYDGGELRLNYTNTWDSDAAIRDASLNYGFSIARKTHVTMSAQWSDGSALLVQDRREALDRGLAILGRNAGYTISGANGIPPMGSLPNIENASGTNVITRGPFGTITNVAFTPNPLTLKSGGSLGSGVTFIPAGTSLSTLPSVLAAGLIANAGKWNTDLPSTNQSPNGLLKQVNSVPDHSSYRLGIRHDLTSNVQIFGEYFYGKNHTVYNTPFDPLTNLRLSASNPTNPFTTDIIVAVPIHVPVTLDSLTTTEMLSFGLIVKLPHDWSGELDYSRSETAASYDSFGQDGAYSTARALGAINFLVDTAANPPDLRKYVAPFHYDVPSLLNDFALRASGPLGRWLGTSATLTFGLERRIGSNPENVFVTSYPITTTNNGVRHYYKREQLTDSVYAESLIPLARAHHSPLLKELDLQVSGRVERYRVDVGTPSYDVFVGQTPPTVRYADPTNNGQPFFATETYRSSNGTIGLKYTPTDGLIFRVSSATAFLPPSPDDLLKNPAADVDPTTIIDPKNGQIYDVSTLSGGNPALVPQHSRSINAGVIWEPTKGWARGLRLNAEYYRIDQFDAITMLEAQDILDHESTFPDRVTRGSNGLVTSINVSSLNLYHSQTEGWDFNGDYRFASAVGQFDFHHGQTFIRRLRRQISLSLPEYDYASYVNEGGAAKTKAVSTIVWSKNNLSAGWTVNYFGEYKQYGAAGGPASLRSAGGADYNTGGYLQAQGSSEVPSQTYHDMFFEYTFPAAGRKWSNSLLSGTRIQLGVKNVFGTLPPFDAYENVYFYVSSYGNIRGREYWLTLRRSF